MPATKAGIQPLMDTDGLDSSMDSESQKWVHTTHLPVSADITPLDSPAYALTPDTSPARVHNRRRTVSSDSDAAASTSSVAGDASDNDNLYDNTSLDGTDDITFEVNGLGAGGGADRNGSAPAWQD
jgi:hypothetical protein